MSSENSSSERIMKLIKWPALSYYIILLSILVYDKIVLPLFSENFNKINSDGTRLIQFNFITLGTILAFYLIFYLFLSLLSNFSFRSLIIFAIPVGYSIIIYLLSNSNENLVYSPIINLVIVLFSFAIYFQYRVSATGFITQNRVNFSQNQYLNEFQAYIITLMDFCLLILLVINQIVSFANGKESITKLTSIHYVLVIPLIQILLVIGSSVLYRNKLTSSSSSKKTVVQNINHDVDPENSMLDHEEIPIEGKESINSSISKNYDRRSISEYIQLKTQVSCEYIDQRSHNSCYGEVTYVCHHCMKALCEEHAYIFIDKEFPKIRRTEGYLIDKGVPPNKTYIYTAALIFVISVLISLYYALFDVDYVRSSQLLGMAIANVLAFIGLYLTYRSLGQARVESSFQRIIKSKYGDEMLIKGGIERQGFYYAVHCWNCFETGHGSLFKQVIEIANSAANSFHKIIRDNATRIADAFLKGLFSDGSQKYHHTLRISHWSNLKQFRNGNQQLSGIFFGFDSWMDKNGEIITPKLWLDPNRFHSLKQNTNKDHRKLEVAGYIFAGSLITVLPPVIFFNPSSLTWLYIRLAFGILNAIAIIIGSFDVLSYFYSYQQQVIREGVFSPEKHLSEMAIIQRNIIEHVNSCVSCANQMKSALLIDRVWNIAKSHLHR